MEMELNKLIDKIKKEGVDEAKKGADDIINDAKKKAEGIINEAEQKRDGIIKAAEAKAKSFEETANKALKQAARDVLLMLRERVAHFSQRIIGRMVKEEFTDDVLKDIIVSAVKNFKKDSPLDIEVLVSEKERDKLEKAVFDILGKEAREGLAIKGSKGVGKGFRIGEKGTDYYVDFSDEAIAEAFGSYLSPRLVERLDIALGIIKEEESGE